jgi:hypothetical protein
MFDDIEIEYNGKTRTIKATEVMRCIAKVEQAVSLPDLVEFMQSGKPRMASLAIGYTALLNYAGFRVTEAQVYAGMFGDQDKVVSAIEATSALMSLMIPPSALNDKKKAEIESQSETDE